MGEIKFDVARMKEINSRLTNITEQLNSSSSENGEELSNIVNNITGDEVISILKQYSQTNDYIIKNTNTQKKHP